MYIGFNYILTAIALGGFFIIPSKTSYFWVFLLIPLVALLTISLNSVFAVFGISIYSLPFNIIVLLFIYVLKLRSIKNTDIKTVTVQEYSPEKNLYSYLNYKNSLSNFQEKVPIQLPFYGEWTVSQAHNGDITHIGDWQHAWDFIIEQDNKQHKDTGDTVKDYYCYSKVVLATADGIIEEIVDGIDDNVIGEVNLEQNWGNTIIIRHHDKLFTKLSHLQKGSFKVVVGELVKSGQELANCGNSGRSPYPHLHFQIQETPFIGSKTIEYPIASYFVNSGEELKLETYSIPKKDDVLKRPIPDKLMQKAFKWTAGKTFKWKNTTTGETIIWDVKINYLNQTYVECRTSKAKAFFTSTDQLFFFTGFEGNRISDLFKFYLSVQKIHKSFFENMEFEQLLRPNDIYKGIDLFIQDFVAPFYVWLKPKLSIKYNSSKIGFTKQSIVIKSNISKRTGEIIKETEITIGEKGFEKVIFDNEELVIK
jgi:murein DD-endopeptidase MepM/ murein hydrolase activator NlpD